MVYIFYGIYMCMYVNYLIFPLIWMYDVCSSLKEFKYTSHICPSSPLQSGQSGLGQALVYINLFIYKILVVHFQF